MLPFRPERPIRQERILSATFAIVFLACSLVSAVFAAFYLDPSFGVVTEGEVIGYTLCCSGEWSDCVECPSIRFSDVGGRWQTIKLAVEEIPQRVRVRYLPVILLIGGNAVIVEEHRSPSAGVLIGVLALVSLGLGLFVSVRYVVVARQYGSDA